MKTIKKGDVLVSKWGYDQTNVDFYLVLKRTNKMVTLQQIGSKPAAQKPAGMPFMTARVIPDQSKTEGKPFSRKVQATYWRNDSDNEEYAAIQSYAHAYVWNGAAQTETSYA